MLALDPLRQEFQRGDEVRSGIRVAACWWWGGGGGVNNGVGEGSVGEEGSAFLVWEGYNIEVYIYYNDILSPAEGPGLMLHVFFDE